MNCALSSTIRALSIFLMMALLARTACGADCSALRELKIEHTEITAAESFAGGTLAPAGAVTFMLEPLKLRGLPPLCRVSGVSRPTGDSEIRFEVWLPEKWNGRYQQLGNGGWAGSIPYEGLAAAVHNGFVAAATDDGHQGKWNDVAWAYGHPERLADFGYRALHVTNRAARAASAALYGRAPEYAYFNGCSDGGRESLMSAQRYPDDFNGWVVGAPASDWSALMAGFLHDLQVVTVVPLGPHELDLVTAAALKACDARDGVIDNPPSCGFDAHSLVCRGQDGGDCLTAAQADAVEKLYDGLRDPRTGAQLVPGLRGTLGTEREPRQWRTWVTGPDATVRDLGNFYRYAVYSDPAFDASKLDPIVALRDGNVHTGAILSAVDPDLGKLRAAGKKIIQFHGWSDAAVPAGLSLRYYEAVRKRLHGDVRDFYRLFMVPGMYHCLGGPGPNAFGGANNPGPVFDADHDVVAALMAWVEHGQAPERIIASKYREDDPTQPVTGTRPLCVYPRVARWNGKSSPADAANYRCESQ